MSGAFGSVGAAIGSTAAGTFGWTAATWTQIGWTAGVLIGTYLFAPDGPDIVNEGPRLDDLKITTSTYGLPIPKLYGAYRISGNIIWALPLQEVKHEETQEEGKGGGGGSSTNIWYTYSATFALALCEGPIAGIRKIWFGSSLVYNNGEFGGGLKNINVTFYKGTNTQDIDWRIEAKYADTPAYRNIAYVVFNNIELEDYGNIIPNVSCEVIKDGEIGFVQISEHSIFWNDSSGARQRHQLAPVDKYASYYSLIEDYGEQIPNFKTNNVYSESKITSYLSGTYTGAFSASGWSDVNAYSTAGSSYNTFFVFDSIGQEIKRIYFIYYIIGGCNYRHIPKSGDGMYYKNDILYEFMGYGNGPKYIVKYDEKHGKITGDYPDNICGLPDGILYYEQEFDIPFIDYTLRGTYTHVAFGDSIIACLRSKTSGTTDNSIDIYSIDTGDFIEELLFTTPIQVDTIYSKIVIADNDDIYIAFNNHIYTSYYNSLHSIIDGKYTYLGSYTAKDEFNHIISLELNRSAISVKDNKLFHMGTYEGAIPRTQATCVIDLSYISSTEILLGEIVNELCLDSGLYSQDINTEAGLANVSGYVVSKNMTARAAIEPLLSAYEFTLVEYDHKIVLRKQNQNSVADILEEELGSNTNNNIEFNIKQELDSIKSLAIKYANADSDYQTSIQQVRRMDVKAKNEVITELSLVLTDTEAKQLVEKMLYRSWEMRKTYSFSLPFTYNYIIAGDIITLLDYGNIDVRITKITITEDNILQCEAVTNNNSTYISNAIGSNTGYNYGLIKGDILNTGFEVLDIPSISNTYINTEGVYTAATGYTNNWSGCNIYSKQLYTDNFTQDIVQLGKMPIGICLDTLGDHSGTIWDLTNSITVFSSEPLSSISMESVLVGNNYILIGSEILQYAIAIDLNDGLYKLEWLLRGRRGTEWATSTHIEAETFIYLKESTIGFIPKTLYNTSFYTALSIGNSIDLLETPKELQYIGNNIKPFSVSNLHMLEIAGENIIDWRPRSRHITGHLKTIETVDTPELYNIDVIDYNTGILINSYTSSTQTFTYTTAMRLADNITDRLEFDISQVSATYGNGEIVSILENI